MGRRGRATFFVFRLESDLFSYKVGGLRNQDVDDFTDVDRDIWSTHFGWPIVSGKPYAGMSCFSGRLDVTKSNGTACDWTVDTDTWANSSRRLDGFPAADGQFAFTYCLFVITKNVSAFDKGIADVSSSMFLQELNCCKSVLYLFYQLFL